MILNQNNKNNDLKTFNQNADPQIVIYVETGEGLVKETTNLTPSAKLAKKSRQEGLQNEDKTYIER